MSYLKYFIAIIFLIIDNYNYLFHFKKNLTYFMLQLFRVQLDQLISIVVILWVNIETFVQNLEGGRAI